ncbi:hypothetical protein G9A89_010879 [Geosiphon pyriformis]|nr:hypothetical protein G9A89_010879 [Geosiphon pyriformis]
MASPRSLLNNHRNNNSPKLYPASPYLRSTESLNSNTAFMSPDHFSVSPTALQTSIFDSPLTRNRYEQDSSKPFDINEENSVHTPLLQEERRNASRSLSSTYVDISLRSPSPRGDGKQSLSYRQSTSTLHVPNSPKGISTARQDYVVNFNKNTYDMGSNNSTNEESDSEGGTVTNSSQSRRGSKAHADVCFPRIEKNDKKGIDYDALEEYVREETERRKKDQRRRQRRLSEPASSFIKDGDKYLHMKGTETKSPNESSYRYTFYSTAYSTVHARSLAEVPPSGSSLTEMLKSGCWWLDILSPGESEMRDLGRIFGIHPLTVEDIETEETREKCELFKNYYFICFRSFDQDHYSPTYLQPVSLYMVVMKEGILSFHYQPTIHPGNVRRRIKQLKDYITVTPDWINYAIIDDITDSFAPLIRSIEFEVDSIDELVLILKESEQTDMLRRIGHCRKKVMGLLRLLGNKADVMKGLVKRCNELRWDVIISNEIVLYLGDIQDHIITMVQNLNHYEKILSRSHSNYLAQISIEMTQANNQINDILSRLTALGTILVPMNLVTGLWGMNVRVPGQPDIEGSLTWFFSILTGILIFAIIGVMMAHRTGIV